MTYQLTFLCLVDWPKFVIVAGQTEFFRTTLMAFQLKFRKAITSILLFLPFYLRKHDSSIRGINKLKGINRIKEVENPNSYVQTLFCTKPTILVEVVLLHCLENVDTLSAIQYVYLVASVEKHNNEEHDAAECAYFGRQRISALVNQHCKLLPKLVKTLQFRAKITLLCLFFPFHHFTL